MNNTINNVSQLVGKDISDELLVDFILDVLPTAEKQKVAARIESDEVLQGRLAHWQEVLFSLNASTEPVKPHHAVWQGVERRLFGAEISPPRSVKRGWLQYVLPALLSIALMVVAGKYWFAQPSYGAVVMAGTSDVMWWRIEAKSDVVNVESVSPMVMPNMQCVAWLQQTNGQWVTLGKVPDAGGNQTVSFDLPEGVTVHNGNKVAIAVVDLSYTKSVPPQPNKMRNDVILTEI